MVVVGAHVWKHTTTAVQPDDYVLGANDELCKVDYQQLLHAR